MTNILEFVTSITIDYEKRVSQREYYPICVGMSEPKHTVKRFAVLESNVPQSELIEISLDNSTLKIDGRYAVCWSASLQFTVERTTKTLIGSAASGEGLVNVYRGTGKVLMAPVTPTRSFAAATE